MSRLAQYKQQLAHHRPEFVSACRETIAIPLPNDADYAGLYYQVDAQSLLPVTLVWITLDQSIDTCQTSPFGRIQTQPWAWTDEDLDLSVHEDAEEYFFQWASECWIEAGGKDYSPLFVLYDHGSMDIYDLSTLEELTDEVIETRVSREA